MTVYTWVAVNEAKLLHKENECISNYQSFKTGGKGLHKRTEKGGWNHTDGRPVGMQSCTTILETLWKLSYIGIHKLTRHQNKPIPQRNENRSIHRIWTTGGSRGEQLRKQALESKWHAEYEFWLCHWLCHSLNVFSLDKLLTKPRSPKL